MMDVSELEQQRGALSDRQRQFVKFHRQIVMAVRDRGADPEENLSLRLAMRRARESKMPDEAVETSRQQGADGEAASYTHATLEGYGPEGVAVFVELLTDDKSRTAQELAEIFEAHGGNLGEDGCVAWQFDRHGLVQVTAETVDDEDTFMMQALEVGAEDVKAPLYESTDQGRVPVYRVHCDYEDTLAIADALDEAGYQIYAASPTREATQHVGLDREQARQFMKFYEQVSSHIDVRNVYANWSSS